MWSGRGEYCTQNFGEETLWEDVNSEGKEVEGMITIRYILRTLILTTFYPRSSVLQCDNRDVRRRMFSWAWGSAERNSGAFRDCALAITLSAVNRDKSVNTETGYGQDNWGLISGSKGIFLHQNVETGSGDACAVFPVISRSERKSRHLRPISVQAHNAWRFMSVPVYVLTCS
jgi:hypothetical protein